MKMRVHGRHTHTCARRACCCWWHLVLEGWRMERRKMAVPWLLLFVRTLRLLAQLQFFSNLLLCKYRATKAVLWGSRRTAWRHGEGGWGCSARVSAPTWPGLGPKPCPGTSSSPSLLSAFAVATYCHFTHRSKGKQAIAASSQNMTLKSDWGEAGDGGAGARGELELCPNEY